MPIPEEEKVDVAMPATLMNDRSQLTPLVPDFPASALGNREGRDCPESYRAGTRLLFAGGRPQLWLWLLVAAFLLVLLRSLA